MDKCTEQLINAIRLAMEETTPVTRPSPHSKRWWSKQLTQLRREANRLRKVYNQTKHPIDRAAWKTKAKEYTDEIAKAKATKWKEYIEQADNKSIWQIKQYIDNTPTSNIISTLNGESTTNEQKAEAFQKSLFPRLMRCTRT